MVAYCFETINRDDPANSKWIYSKIKFPNLSADAKYRLCHLDITKEMYESKFEHDLSQ